ncbi:alpha/beta hydrolase domain-containing protein [Aurantiacibacter suaedae]|uniref:alpha/beta hydrolase domain-containing protein n=1 Tax=Aurantiacibacter suaedae TaxID=2545755 RepID=UPI0010F77B05|nr:alpha/beta hydrolase domain-containing protein [Aurantiacibacter suaedae]
MQEAVRVAPAVVPIPEATNAIPVTDKSWPWAAADRAVSPIDLSAHGYVEEEYFITGTARVFDMGEQASLTSLAQGPYTTRILVRRPAHPAEFSGTVVVEPLNPSIRYDLPIMWGESHASYIRNGDIWIGVTVKPVAIATLKEFDSRRYQALEFPNPVPASLTCGQDQLPLPRGGLPPESSPATENGLIWDVLSQVAALARNGKHGGPLAGFDVSRMYMAGDSQSGAFVLTYANFIHQYALGQDRTPLYDGYLAAVASGPGTPLNQCANPLPTDDPRMRIADVGVPVIVMVSESEIGSLRRRPDSDLGPDLFRGYEVAGASHIHEGGEAGSPSPIDAARTSGAVFDNANACQEQDMPGNDVPFAMLLSGAFRNLDRWSREGVPPPRGEPLEVDKPGTPDAQVLTDEFGNALGGVRTPQVDVPVARYYHRMTGPGICELWGYRKPFTADVLEALYPTREAYLSRFRQSVDSLIAERWIEPEDGQALLRQASDAASLMND